MQSLDTTTKIAFGGSCHWCTEAIFQSLIGVSKVEQGWIASIAQDENFSEAVIVHFDEEIISLASLIEIHLNTHSCTSDHSLRKKYRSAVYFFNETQETEAKEILANLQNSFAEKIITEVLPFVSFKINEEHFLNYYYSNPEKPFCQNIINPKLKRLLQQFSSQVDEEKLNAEKFGL